MIRSRAVKIQIIFSHAGAPTSRHLLACFIAIPALYLGNEQTRKRAVQRGYMERQNPQARRQNRARAIRASRTREARAERMDRERIAAVERRDAQPRPASRQASVLQKPLGVLFDLGDTLLTHLGFDPEAGIAATLDIAHNPSGYAVKDIGRRIEKMNRDLILRREKAQVEFHPHIVQRHIYEALHITFDCAPEEVERVFWRAAMSWRPEPDVEHALETLKEKRMPMGIVSNAAFCGDTLWWEIDRQGLAGYFQFLMSSADYWVRKPHPLILETAAAKLGVKPADVWYVGNAPQYDIAGAHNAGMGAVWYNRLDAPLDGPEPHVEIKNWREFLFLIERY